jgi:coenzyme F420-dependent glucose-6-phosphate dehydrogenase
VKVQASLAWAPTKAEAREGAWSQWRGNVIGGDALADWRTCADFEAAAEFVTEDDVARRLTVSHEPLEHAERLQEYVDAGATDIYLFNVAPRQREFIEVFAERVLPAVRGAR